MQNFFECEYGMDFINVSYNSLKEIVLERHEFRDEELKESQIILSRKNARKLAKEILRITNEKEENLIYGI